MLHVVGLSNLDYCHHHWGCIHKKESILIEFFSRNVYIMYMEEIMTIEQMRQRSAEARRIAKELQRQLQGITDAEERKLLSQRMNDLFAEAKKLMDGVKAQRGWEASVEREFNGLSDQ